MPALVPAKPPILPEPPVTLPPTSPTLRMMEPVPAKPNRPTLFAERLIMERFEII